MLTGFETLRQAANSVLQGQDDIGLLLNAEVISEIHHCLLGLSGATLDSIRVVLSHPQALAQCDAYLRAAPWLRSETEFDTAGAARKVKRSGDKTVAAIASESAARIFGLEILEHNIQDQSSNYTRFVEVATEASTCPPDEPCKTSVMLSVGHQPGDLGEVLRQFSSRGVNLSKLESRPIPEERFNYRFYLDIEGHSASQAVSAALEAVEPLTKELRILGTYPKATIEPPAPSGSG